MIQLVCVMALIAMLSNKAPAQMLAERILTSYDPVQSVSCEIRKDSEAGAGKMRMLSRVYYEKPDRLHVDQPAPIPRRIVADGKTFYSYDDARLLGAVCRLRLTNETDQALASLRTLTESAKNANIRAMAAYELGRCRWSEGDSTNALVFLRQAFVETSTQDLFLRAGCSLDLLVRDFPILGNFARALDTGARERMCSGARAIRRLPIKARSVGSLFLS